MRQVVALEQVPLSQLPGLPLAGTKLLVADVPVRRGTLLLRPDNTDVLGGRVAALEAARCAAMEVWNRPIGACVGWGVHGRVGWGMDSRGGRSMDGACGLSPWDGWRLVSG